MAPRWRTRAAETWGMRSESGFTLIEVLIISLIIATLAAIAIPAFTGQRGKANDAAAKTALRTVQTAIQTHFTMSDTYVVSPDVLRSEEPGLASGAGSTLEIAGGVASYVAAVTSVSGTRFSVQRDAAGVQRQCDAPGLGGCPASGRW